MEYSSEDDRHSGMFSVTDEGSGTDYSPLRIMSCKNRAKVLVPPLSNRLRSPILDVPAAVGDQGFSDIRLWPLPFSPKRKEKV